MILVTGDMVSFKIYFIEAQLTYNGVLISAVPL